MAPRSGPRPTTWGQGRQSLLAAARELFSEKGYRGAGTREIAARANISEPMIYKHFGSKAALFEEAVAEPFVRFIEDYFDRLRAGRMDGRSDFDAAYQFLADLYTLFRRERRLVVALLAAREFDSELGTASRNLEVGFERVLKLFDAMLTVEAERRGYRQFSTGTWARVILGSIMALAVHSPLLSFDEVDSPRAAITEFAEMLTRGARS